MAKLAQNLNRFTVKDYFDKLEVSATNTIEYRGKECTVL
jgi:hypothetical protein